MPDGQSYLGAGELLVHQVLVLQVGDVVFFLVLVVLLAAVFARVEQVGNLVNHLLQ